jgi:CRISPR-associated Csx10 family RAMP protein
MIELELTLQTEAPLALRASRTSQQFTPTLTHIPGVTLRGALAMEYLRRGGKAEDSNFQTLFLSEDVSFGSLFPSEGDFASCPLPASVVACKRYGAKHGDSVGDSLLRLELADQREDLTPLTPWEDCPNCKREYPDLKPNKRDRLTGYYYFNENNFGKIKLKIRMLPGVGISRLTHTAAQGLLFSMEAIEEAQCFCGRIRLYGDDTQSLQAELEKLVPKGDFLRLGGARTRGQGRVKVIEWKKVAPNATPTLNERWTQLNQAVQKLWGNTDPRGEYFSLTLESPAILLDDCLHPIHPSKLCPGDFGLPEGVEMRRRMLTETNLQGWQAKWQLPKYDTPALGIESVFLFRASPELRDEIQARLRIIESDGLGERRNEGLGRVRACDPFHTRVD